MAISLCQPDKNGKFLRPKFGCVNKFGLFRPGIFIKENEEEEKKFLSFKEGVERFGNVLSEKEMAECTHDLKSLKPNIAKEFLLNIYKS